MRGAAIRVRGLTHAYRTDPGPLTVLDDLDLTVADVGELAVQRDRALSLGAKILLDRSADADEPLYVFGDPAGHPFCIFVSPDHPG